MKKRWPRYLVISLLGGLLVYEVFALSTDHETISRMVHSTTEEWGIFPFVVGTMVGSLATHFWWRWEPRESKKGGG